MQRPPSLHRSPRGPGLPTTTLAPGNAVLGGIVGRAWNDKHWIAAGSVVALKPTDLRRWNPIPGLRSWVARHKRPTPWAL